MKDLEYLKYIAGKYPVKKRYKNILTQIQDILEAMNILDDVMISKELLGQAILDYFEDIDRLKQYEGIKKINVDKIYSYETFWLLRRKPIHFTSESVDIKFLHINEKVFTAIIVAKMLKEMKINVSVKNAKILNFMELIYYNFKYRIITQKSLELMVASFFCGYSFTEQPNEECTSE